MSLVRLKPGREKSVLNRHPWLFSGAIKEADCRDGDIADVYSSQGEWLARGYYNSHSQIRLRLLTWQREEAIDDDFWRRRLQQAVAGRRLLPDWPASSLRLVNAESDGLPGLVVDLYVGRPSDGGEAVAVAVLQSLTLGIEQRKESLAHLLSEVVVPNCLPALGHWEKLAIYERSDVDMRQLEGLAPSEGYLLGEALPEGLVVKEGSLSFLVDITHGHKTGMYLDQAGNRLRVASYCRDARVLNAFAYSGGFSIHALANGALSVADVDTSATALAAGRENVILNCLLPERRGEVEGDVFQALRRFREERRQFDVVILDPPKFAHTGRQVQAACRGYKDINLLGMNLLAPGGILATFSCSGLVSPDLFQKVVFGAAVDAGREVQILENLSQGPDHPIALTFPEGRYLKGFICRVW